MGDKWIVVVRVATSSVTSETAVEEFDNLKDAQEHFDGLRSAGVEYILDAYLAAVHMERH